MIALVYRSRLCAVAGIIKEIKFGEFIAVSLRTGGCVMALRTGGCVMACHVVCARVWRVVVVAMVAVAPPLNHNLA